MRKKELTDKQLKTVVLIGVALAAAFMAAVLWLVGEPMIRFVSQPDKFRDWVDGHGVGGRLAYMGMVLFQVVFAILPGEPFEVAGGYAFGALEGTVLCLAAATAGSMLVFLFVRRFGVRFVRVFFSEEKIASLRFLKTNKKRVLLLLLIFMLPGTPKDLLCYYAGLTDIKLPAWLLICSFGRIPSVVTSTLGGSALGTRQYLLSGVIFLATLVISAVGLTIYYRICRQEK